MRRHTRPDGLSIDKTHLRTNHRLSGYRRPGFESVHAPVARLVGNDCAVERPERPGVEREPCAASRVGKHVQTSHERRRLREPLAGGLRTVLDDTRDTERHGPQQGPCSLSRSPCAGHVAVSSPQDTPGRVRRSAEAHQSERARGARPWSQSFPSRRASSRYRRTVVSPRPRSSPPGSPRRCRVRPDGCPRRDARRLRETPDRPVENAGLRRRLAGVTPTHGVGLVSARDSLVEHRPPGAGSDGDATGLVPSAPNVRGLVL